MHVVDDLERERGQRAVRIGLGLRVVRARGNHESATVFLPAVRPLLALAAELEDERNHVIPPPAQQSEELLANLSSLPADKQTPLRNQAGGHANHTLFWENMSPDGGGEPTGELADAINAAFGSFADFQAKFEDNGVTQFGSGWTWLVLDGGALKLTKTANQDSPILEGQVPLLGNDVWEHAYYLKYQNKRPDYLKAWWNTVNWAKVAERYSAAK